MGELFLFGASAVSAAWAIAMLVGIWKIVAAVTFKQFPMVNTEENGTEYRIQVIRSHGRFGATYQMKGGEPMKVEPTFASYAEVSSYIRKSIKP